jgi:two-component system, response regulator PdtaR
MIDLSLRILVVEDEFFIASMIEDALLDAGHTIVGMEDHYAGAVQKAALARPDLALLDLHLIGPKDGIDVAAELKKMGVPCLFTTGHCAAGRGDRLAVGCLHKPFTPDELVGAVQAARRIALGHPPGLLPRTMHPL